MLNADLYMHNADWYVLLPLCIWMIMIRSMFYVFKYLSSELYVCMFMFMGLDAGIIWCIVASSSSVGGSRMLHLIGSRCPLLQLSICEHQPRNTIAPDSTSGVYVLIVAHVIPYWVCGRISRVHSLSTRLYNPHLIQKRYRHCHFSSLSIWPFFINKNLSKTITRLIRIIPNHSNQQKWAIFSCAYIYIYPRLALLVCSVFDAGLAGYRLSRKG